MHRRALLATLGGLTAGCVTGPAGGRQSTPTADPSTYRIDDIAVSTTTDRPDSRYLLEPTAFYSADAVDREREGSDEDIVVMDVSEIDDPAVREAVETALPDDEWRGDSLPDGLATLVEQVDFFTGRPNGDTYTHIGLELYELDPDSRPVTFDATVPDDQVAPEDPGRFVFSLRNTGSEPQEVFSGTVPPFGLVSATRVDGPGEFLLWRDYEAEGCISFTDEGIVSCDIGKITELAPGERLTREYAVLPPTTDHYPDRTVPPGAGQYRIAESLSYSTGAGGPSSTLRGEVTFALTGIE